MFDIIVPILKRHSLPGIVSTIIGSGIPLLVLMLTIITIALDSTYYAGGDVVQTLEFISKTILYTIAAAELPLHVIGILLAVTGLSLKAKEKIFAVIGMTLNLLFGFISIGIAILWLFAWLLGTSLLNVH